MQSQACAEAEVDHLPRHLHPAPTSSRLSLPCVVSAGQMDQQQLTQSL
jgi:hypothetical protein